MPRPWSMPQRLLAALSFVALQAGCSALPSLEGRSVSTALGEAEARETALGRAIAPLADRHPGMSGILELDDALHAFAARVLLAHAAQRTLDVQYYIWRGDTTGMLLFDALHSAAKRGVRVRLLLDDNGTSGLDGELAALDGHPNIEVRLFNPFVVRSPKPLGYLTDFSRLNRRMHNKSFTADNQATIVGGRNIGDEYFGATEGVLYVDLDVLAVGEVVGEVSRDFDRYWSSASAYPASLILPPVDASMLEAQAALADRIESDPKAAAYVGSIRGTGFAEQLLRGELEFEWAATRMVSDDPAKGLGKASGDGLLTHQFLSILARPESELALVSPYFVPTATGVDTFAGITERGVKVRILTNGLEATDVAAVHAGYARYRKPLLEVGVELHEMRRLSPARKKERAGPFGSSGSSLHAKTFAVDGRQIFVGSFNFDPRSAKLNTELGFVIDSPKLARKVHALFDDDLASGAYQVLLDEQGSLIWAIREHGEPRVSPHEPGASFWRRTGVLLLSLLPIEWLL